MTLNERDRKYCYWKKCYSVANYYSYSDGRDNMAYADCGFIAQNVYLLCASENLGCVIRGYVDKEAVAKLLNLKTQEKVILSQTIGFPK